MANVNDLKRESYGESSGEVGEQVIILEGGGGGGAVDSVNGQTGVVVLDTSHIADTIDKRYVTDAQVLLIDNSAQLGTAVAFTSVNINGTNGAGHIHLKHQASDPSSTGSSSTVFADSNGNLAWLNNGLSKVTFDTDAVTAARTYTFKDESGTVAFLSDITGGSALTYSAISTSQAIVKNFFYGVDATAGEIILTLANGTTSGETLRVKKIDTSGNYVTINGNIDGDTSISLSVEDESVDLFWNGTNYLIF